MGPHTYSAIKTSAHPSLLIFDGLLLIYRKIFQIIYYLNPFILDLFIDIGSVNHYAEDYWLARRFFLFSVVPTCKILFYFSYLCSISSLESVFSPLYHARKSSFLVYLPSSCCILLLFSCFVCVPDSCVSVVLSRSVCFCVCASLLKEKKRKNNLCVVQRRMWMVCVVW